MAQGGWVSVGWEPFPLCPDSRTRRRAQGAVRSGMTGDPLDSLRDATAGLRGQAAGALEGLTQQVPYTEPQAYFNGIVLDSC